MFPLSCFLHRVFETFFSFPTHACTRYVHQAFKIHGDWVASLTELPSSLWASFNVEEVLTMAPPGAPGCTFSPSRIVAHFQVPWLFSHVAEPPWPIGHSCSAHELPPPLMLPWSSMAFSATLFPHELATTATVLLHRGSYPLHSTMYRGFVNIGFIIMGLPTGIRCVHCLALVFVELLILRTVSQCGLTNGRTKTRSLQTSRA